MLSKINCILEFTGKEVFGIILLHRFFLYINSLDTGLFTGCLAGCCFWIAGVKNGFSMRRFVATLGTSLQNLTFNGQVQCFSGSFDVASMRFQNQLFLSSSWTASPWTDTICKILISWKTFVNDPICSKIGQRRWFDKMFSKTN